VWGVLTARGLQFDIVLDSVYTLGMAPLSDQIRQAIRESGMTGYQLHQLSGLSQSRIAAFLRGGSLTSCNLDRLLAAIPAKFKKTLRP